MPPRVTRKSAISRAASPPPDVASRAVVAGESPAAPIPAPIPEPIPAQAPASPLSIKPSHLASLLPSPVAQTIPSVIVWAAFTASVHLTTPPFTNNLQSISSICKLSALALGIVLTLSSANIIPKIAHQILLFVTVPLYVLQSDFSRVTSNFSHLFENSGKVTAHLTALASADLSTDVQHFLTLAVVLLIFYALFFKAFFGREAAVAFLYGALAYFIVSSAFIHGETASLLTALTTSGVLLFLALHQFLNAPSAPAAYRNVFLATAYYIAIIFSLTLRLSVK